MERSKELYERQIKIVDDQIDRLVYDLYEADRGGDKSGEEVPIKLTLRLMPVRLTT